MMIWILRNKFQTNPDFIDRSFAAWGNTGAIEFGSWLNEPFEFWFGLYRPWKGWLIRLFCVNLSHKSNQLTSALTGKGLSWRVLNSLAASADIWNRLQKFGVLDFESKLFDELMVRNWGGGGGVAVNPLVNCFGGVELSSIDDCFVAGIRAGSAIAVACEKKASIFNNSS